MFNAELYQSHFSTCQLMFSYLICLLMILINNRYPLPELILICYITNIQSLHISHIYNTKFDIWI